MTPELAQILRSYAERAATDMKQSNLIQHTGMTLEFLLPNGLLSLRVSVALVATMGEKTLADHIHEKILLAAPK